MALSKYYTNFILLFSILLTGCAGPAHYQVELLPSPYVYTEGLVDPFPKEHPSTSNLPYSGILYVTDREPADSRHEEVYYRNKRGYELRLGQGEIELDRLSLGIKSDMTWEEMVEVSKQKVRNQAYPLQVHNFKEYGFLTTTKILPSKEEVVTKSFHQAENEFANLINKKLALSKKKDIYIYVHGYRTIFEDPLLVGTSFWHYMGYDGVFIAYAWPATPRSLAYFGDIDTARMTNRNLRLFLEYLSTKTQVEDIHIIGYSMGTRVVTDTIRDISLLSRNITYQKMRKNFKIGNIILIGSDIERGVFGTYLLDGLLRVPKTITIYASETDSAVSFSRWLFERNRLGESWGTNLPDPRYIEFMKKNTSLRFIDVTGAENAATGNGHHYFTESPWVSSDVLLTLLYDLPPQKRGLLFNTKTQTWFFPKDYDNQVSIAIQKVDPVLRGIK
jgi:esterase/lipase superfamily enzyme